MLKTINKSKIIKEKLQNTVNILVNKVKINLIFLLKELSPSTFHFLIYFEI